MRIKRIHLSNFRTFGEVTLDNLPDVVVLISRNGLGKSSILEAVASAKELVGPYVNGRYFRSEGSPRWPRSLRPAARGEKGIATIELTVQVDGHERQTVGASANEGRIVVKINEAGELVHSEAPKWLAPLLQFNPPERGIGYLDYYRPSRVLPTRFGVSAQLTPIDSGTVRETFEEIGRPPTENAKFNDFKQFVFNSVFQDFTHYCRDGSNPDCLKVLKDAVSKLLQPKFFVGIAGIDEGSPRVLMNSLGTEVDIDVLSDGERELIYILGRLFRYRHLESTVLWDTPELHLNGGLQSRLIPLIQQLAPRNQYWIATHSMELVGSVPDNNLFLLRDGDSGVTVECIGATPKIARQTELAAQLGASPAVHLVSSLTVFLEGAQARSDRYVVSKFLATRYPRTYFVAGGNNQTILEVGARANELLKEIVVNGKMLIVLDRDYYSEIEVGEIRNRYSSNVWFWPMHELENMFLNENIVLQTLRRLGAADKVTDVAQVRSRMLKCANELKDWIVADMVLWSLSTKIKSFNRTIRIDNATAELSERVEELRTRFATATDASAVSVMSANANRWFDEQIHQNLWEKTLPGKQLLGRFLSQVCDVGREIFCRTALEYMLSEEIVPDPIALLATEIEVRLA